MTSTNVDYWGARPRDAYQNGFKFCGTCGRYYPGEYIRCPFDGRLLRSKPRKPARRPEKPEIDPETHGVDVD
jgi:hypothetical protein